jgi:hypothetical protein
MPCRRFSSICRDHHNRRRTRSTRFRRYTIQHVTVTVMIKRHGAGGRLSTRAFVFFQFI